MAYLIQPVGISNFQIKKVFAPYEVNDDDLKTFINKNNLKSDLDFHEIYPDAVRVLTQPHKIKNKRISGWFERKQEGIGIVIWKKIKK